MATWFTADWHLGHKNIIRLDQRPFRDLDHMERTIFARYQLVVEPGDVVYHLGDVAFGNLSRWASVIRDLPGHKILIPGNHDQNWEQPRKDAKYLDAGFDAVIRAGSVRIDSKIFRLSHLPSNGDSQKGDRYQHLRPTDAPNNVHIICGHVHGAWMKQGLNINVGVTIRDYTPVSADIVLANTES